MKGSFSPQILKGSRDLAKGRKTNVPTHERLYNEQKEQRQRRESLTQDHDKVYSFKPKISKRSASVGRSRPNLNGQSIFERLNAEAEDIMAKKKKRAEEKSKAEMKECSFVPKLSDDTREVAKNGADRSGDNNMSIWDRLNVDKSGQIEMREQIKDQKELEECTFAPKLLQKQPSDESGSQADEMEDKKSSEPIHVRLHRDSILRKKNQDYHKAEHEKAEVQDCSFRPTISKRAPSPMRGARSSNPDSPVWDRLANEVNWKEREQLLNRKKEQQEIASCSFQPAINRGPRLSLASPNKTGSSKAPKSPISSPRTATSPISSPNAENLDMYMASLNSKLQDMPKN